MWEVIKLFMILQSINHKVGEMLHDEKRAALIL